MKFSQVFLAHNIYRWTYRQLFFTGRRQVYETNLYQQMINNPEFKLTPATDVIKEDVSYGGKRLPIRGMRFVPPGLNESHPDWHADDDRCLVYKDRDVLVGGLKQAKILTNTIEIQEGLPSHLTSVLNEGIIENETELIQRALASTIVYDTEQKKIGRYVDPERPAHRYPIETGITDVRKNFLLCHRFMHLAELLAGYEISKNRCKMENAYFSVPLIRNEDVIQLQLRSDIMVFANEPLKPLCDPKITLGTELPDLNPMKYTISLRKENLYKLENIFPVTRNTKFNRVHTAFIHFTPSEVKNLYGTPVLDTQTISRSLMKSFTIAAAQARYLYGEEVKILPEPVVIQCIQTDSKYFHFSVFQLNTLSWPPCNTEVRNVFWSDSIKQAYDFGGYFQARPTITSYNPEIFGHVLAFYHNR